MAGGVGGGNMIESYRQPCQYRAGLRTGYSWCIVWLVSLRGEEM